MTARIPLRLEDLVMAGWIAIASPILFRIGGDRGPFDPGQTVPGLLRLAAVVGVLVCLSARRAPDPAASPGSRDSMVSRGAFGPFAGGLLLVTIAGYTALNVPSPLVLASLVAAACALIAVRFVVPPLSLNVRRALVSPFAIIAGGLYWTFIEAVIPPKDAASVRQAAMIDPHAAGPVLLFLAGFSIVYYAMLVYAPRQIAEREGGLVEWGIRYAAFVVSVAFGIGWLSIVSG